MDELFTAASNHPLVTIIIVATALVVALYLIRKHFWRIFLVLVLTCIGYYLYSNGYFSKDKLQDIKSVDLTKIEKGAEQQLDKGVNEVRSITGQKVEQKADSVRDDVKKEMMTELKSAPDKSANAAAATAAKKKPNPSAGDSDAAKNRSHSKTAP
jgi:uncharacterized membrane protein